MKTYHIEQFENNAWTTDGLGENISFDSREEAEKTIEDLRKLGEDWKNGTYRVVQD